MKPLLTPEECRSVHQYNARIDTDTLTVEDLEKLVAKVSERTQFWLEMKDYFIQYTHPTEWDQKTITSILQESYQQFCNYGAHERQLRLILQRVKSRNRRTLIRNLVYVFVWFSVLAASLVWSILS